MTGDLWPALGEGEEAGKVPLCLPGEVQVQLGQVNGSWGWNQQRIPPGNVPVLSSGNGGCLGQERGVEGGHKDGDFWRSEST